MAPRVSRIVTAAVVFTVVGLAAVGIAASQAFQEGVRADAAGDAGVMPASVFVLGVAGVLLLGIAWFRFIALITVLRGDE
ncbi:hypothetical protein [Microbacterium terricola]|uniref:Uncharacterized protein n=1 Tax=Microbacterium terricola TaxID=344163 RepID=A0ABM8DUU8_9MICO|nr:hypothetical protein [Microbacterium terricola]UYK39863.1 hypothetical protein OAU46_14380 [Microbacterium terricola]BDV29383.1 hypothetical protein Microterr_00430 [Microbacterium terricola]